MGKKICSDCPDLDVCISTDARCEFVIKMDQALKTYEQALQGRTTRTMSNNKNTTTPADVAAKAAEEKLVVPAQTTKVEITEEGVTTIEEPKLKVVSSEDAEGNEKKSPKERVQGLVAKAKERKKLLIGLGVTAGVMVYSFAKYAKKQVEAQVAEEQIEGELDPKPTDETAA